MEKVLMNLVLDLEIISTTSLWLYNSWKLCISSAALWVQPKKIRNKTDEMCAGHCWSFGVALRDGCKKGIGLTASGQKPTPPFLNPGELEQKQMETN